MEKQTFDTECYKLRSASRVVCQEKQLRTGLEPTLALTRDVHLNRGAAYFKTDSD